MLPDSVATAHAIQFDSIFSLTDVILGLPLLRQFGSVEFDFEKNKMNITDKADVEIQQEITPNMFMMNSALYGCVFMDSLKYVGLIDTGARQITLSVSPSFYERNKDCLSPYRSDEIIKKTMYGMSSVDEESYYPILLSKVLFADVDLRLKKGDILLDTKESPAEWKDGLIGLPFFKRLGSRVKFDFVNMKVTSDD